MLVGDEARGTWATPAPIRAAFFDIDGTLSEFGTTAIVPSAKRAVGLMRDKGVLAFVSTGRAPAHAREVVGDLFDGIIAMNGMFVQVGDEIIHHQPLPRSAVERLVSLAGDGWQIVFQSLGRSFVSSTDDPDVEGVSLGAWIEPGDARSALDEVIYQASLYLDPADEAEFRKGFPGCELSRWHPMFADIFSAGGGKAQGIARVLGRLGIEVGEAIAFGDAPNDVSMFGACGTSVAVASGFPEAVAAATFVTESPADDGIHNACVRLGIL